MGKLSTSFPYSTESHNHYCFLITVQFCIAIFLLSYKSTFFTFLILLYHRQKDLVGAHISYQAPITLFRLCKLLAKHK